MSWQQYLDNMQSDGTVKDAAICGTNPESVWAATPGLQGITPAEIRKVMKDRSDFFSKGAYIAGKKYMLIRDELDEDPQYFLDMKSAKGEDNIAYQMVISKCKQVIVIGLGSKDAQGGQVKGNVHKIAVHLRESNF